MYCGCKFFCYVIAVDAGRHAIKTKQTYVKKAMRTAVSIHTTTNIIFTFQVFPSFYPLAKWHWIWSLDCFWTLNPFMGWHIAYRFIPLSLLLPFLSLSLSFLFSCSFSYSSLECHTFILSVQVILQHHFIILRHSSGFFFLVSHSGDHLHLSTSVRNKSSHTSHH